MTRKPFLLVFAAGALAVAAACAPFPKSAVVQGPKQSGLWFSQAPAGARVTVDGADDGEAASYDGRKALLAVSPGPHRVVVTLGGVRLYDENVYIDAGARMQIRVPR